MNRRSVIKALSALPAFSKLAAKEASESKIMEIAGIYTNTGNEIPQPSGNEQDRWKKLLAIDLHKEQVLKMLYEEQKQVGRIDLDIATKRNWSLAAKTTYQRQRNVSRRLDELQNGYLWSRMDKLLDFFKG